MKFKLTLIVALAFLTSPVTNCGVFSKLASTAKNVFRSSFAKPPMLRLFDPKSIVLDDKYKDNPGVKVSLAVPKTFPYVSEMNRVGLEPFIISPSADEQKKYEYAHKFAKNIIEQECTGPVTIECAKALSYSMLLVQAKSLNPIIDTKKMAEEGVKEIYAQRWTVAGMIATIKAWIE